MAQTDLRFTFEPACNTSGAPQQHIAFDVVEFKLVEGLSECYRLEVELLSSDAAVDFGLLLDQGATFTIWQGGEAVRQIHGLISELSQGSTGFRRTRYRAVIEPQLARTQLRSDWRIFQQQTVPEILAQIFKADQIPNHVINTQSEHLQREYCVQAGDSDYDFIARLAAEEGFIYRFNHSQSNHQLLLTDVVQSYGAIGTQQETTTHTAANTGNQQQATPAQTVLYQPTPGGDRQQPALRTFTYQEQVRTSSQTQRDYTFKNPPYTQQHSRYGQNLEHQSQHYERYDYPGRYKQDAAGEPFTQTRIQSLRRDARIAITEGDDARLEPGLAFELTGHAREDMNTLWRPIHIEHSGTQHTAGEEEAAGAQQSTSYTQTAYLVPATTDWKAPIPAKPLITGPLIGHVAGPEGEEIYTDEHGRVKIHFPWDRTGHNDQHSTCWIRVAQNWAGAAWGHIAIPRIGQEVIVDFLDGDPDQPIINGRTYDAQHPVPYKLPALKTQMTIKSKEHKGSGFNELLIDDTTGEIKTQLHSTYGTTQLTMGYLTHPRKDDGSGEERGHGFELRTDEWGAIRAAKGLYISTNTREKAEGKQLDLQEAIEQLQNALTIARKLASAANTSQQAIPADTTDQEQQLAGVYTDLVQPAILMSAPQGVALTTPKSAQFSAEKNLTFTSYENTDMSAWQDIRAAARANVSLFAAEEDMKLVAGKGKVRMQASDNDVEIYADKTLKVISTQDKIEIVGEKEILLTSGGAYIRIKDGNIDLHAPGVIEHKAADYPFMGPASMNYAMPVLSPVEAVLPLSGAHNLRFHFTDDDGVPYANTRYTAYFTDGTTTEGRTDADGYTQTYYANEPDGVKIHLYLDDAPARPLAQTPPEKMA